MYGECAQCKDTELPLTSTYDAQANVSYNQVSAKGKKKNKDKVKEQVPVKVTVKQEMESAMEELVEMFQNQLQKFRRHLFNIKQQFLYHRELKKNMSAHECLIHIDFSENYSCKFGSEIQAVHFASSQQQATLHTGVLYLGGKEEHVCFSTISPSKQKGPPAIWEYLAPVLDHLKEVYPFVSVVHFFSDGPCTQYRQKGNFYLFSTELHKRGFTAGTWNFFEASHGKGAPDGVGGVLKRTADRLVSHGRDIPSAAHLFKSLCDAGTTVKLFYVDNDTVDKATKEMPTGLPIVPSTMKIHQLITLAPGKLTYRDVSCLCSTQQVLECQCYNTQNFSFAVQLLSESPEPADWDIQWQNPDVLGKWCVLKYEDELYPGIVLQTNETHVQVKCMHRVGSNRFY